MRGRSALLLLAVIAVFVTPAPVRAACPVPDPSSCILAPCLSVVGHNGLVADPAGTYTITVMCDPVTPLAGVPVTLIFDACSDIAICTQQLDPTKTVTCGVGVKQISGLTDALGNITFTVIGGGTPIDFSSPTCMTVTAGVPPVVIGSVAVSAFDLDGIGGVGANDLSIFFLDFGTGNPLPRSDYDCTGNVGANDFSFWLTIFGGGQSAGGCTGVMCP